MFRSELEKDIRVLLELVFANTTKYFISLSEEGDHKAIANKESGENVVCDYANYKRKAAQYLRMSTDHQKYSIDNQQDAISKYASSHGIEIVKTYRDDGKSGLSLSGRNGLERLLDDIHDKANKFDTILIYDVSRWGRFQDPDESAYYEHLCKRADLKVIYCAEQFENDGSLLNVTEN